MGQKLIFEIQKGNKSALTKKEIISHYIYNGNSTLNDLAHEVGLSVPTVTKFVGEMVDDGYIIDYGKLETTSGRHPNVYGLNSESGYFVGVDICKFSMSIGLMNFKGDMVEMRHKVPYKFENTPESLEILCAEVKDFISELTVGTDKIMNVCVSIPGRVNPDSGYSYSVFNFSEVPLAEVLTQKIGYPVCIDNDTRVMAYGEFLRGCVNGEKDVVFINMSWGLGMGIIIDGKMYKGRSGFSGEFGHVSVYKNEILCHCGKKGCLETEVSGSAFERKLIARVNGGEASILTDQVKQTPGSLTIDDLVEAVNKEDLLCIDIVEEMGEELGRHIASLINIFNPELVVIGGVLSHTGDYLRQPIKTAARKFSLNYVNRDSAIVTSKLGDKAGIVGACMMARSRMFDL